MNKKVYLKIIILSVLIMGIFTFAIINLRKTYFENIQTKMLTAVEKAIKDIDIQDEKEIEVDINQNEEVGLIIIPSLNIKAPIYEGTTSEILKFSVGHFENTKLWDGNVALASHNRGSYAHYFSEINKLEKGEEIIYITNMGERRYQVIQNKIIDETNVDILKNTDENIITLITCVTNKKNKRQCIIGKEI